MTLLWSCLVLPSPAVRAAPPDAGVPKDPDLTRIDNAVGRLAEESRAAGFSHMRAKDYPAALRELNTVYGLNGEDPEVTEQLARLHVLMGDREQAESFYRETLALDRGRGGAALALAELLLGEPSLLNAERLSEVDELLAQAERQLGRTLAVRLASARAAAAGGDYELASRAYVELLKGAGADPALWLEAGDFHRDFGHYEAALGAYRNIERPASLVRTAAQRIFDVEVRRYGKRFHLASEQDGTSPEVTSLLTRARVSAEQGELAQADALLKQAIAKAPGYAPARAQWAALQARAGHRGEAERGYLQALALGGQEADYLAALAELYMTEDPPRDVEAAVYLRRALSQRPEWAALHLRLARVERRRGDLPRALAHVRRFLDLDRSVPKDAEALALEAEVVRGLGEGSEVAAAPLEATPTSPALIHLARAQEHMRRGATDAALVVLDRVPPAQRTEEVVLLHARILQASGRLDEAASVLRGLLKQRPASRVRLSLAEVLDRAGDPNARAEWAEAERRGHREATVALARADVADGSPLALLHARRRALRLLEDTQAGSLRATATTLLAGANRGLAGWVAVLLGCLALPTALLWLARRHRYGGIDLSTFATRHPDAGPELQTILSALRHEVLKHNTMMLAGLRDALSAGQPAGEHGRHLVRALFGSHGVEGAYDRLLTYGRQLEQLGRAHGQRINLRHQDPVMAALFMGMAILKRCADKLERLDTLGERSRRRVLKQVQEADLWLNQEGYGQLRALLDQVRVYAVSPAAPVAIFERVRAEPGLAALSIAPLAYDDGGVLPCTVDMPQAAFEDIMANLMRNALQSSARARPSGAAQRTPLEVGLSVREEMDPITALSRVLFLVWDRSAEPLSAEQLRGHYIEQGLGLTADLATRYQASLEVVPGEGQWTKAVALAMPLVVEDEPSRVDL